MKRIFFLFLFSTYIFADDIELHNGKKYEDVKYSRSKEQVTLELKNCSKVTLKYNEIKSKTSTTPNWNCNPPITIVPKIEKFYPSRTEINEGDKIKLFWEVKDIASIKIEPNVGGDLKVPKGETQEFTLASTTKYKLTAYKNGVALTNPKPQEINVTVIRKTKVKFKVNLQDKPEGFKSELFGMQDLGYSDYGKLVWQFAVQLIDKPDNCGIEYQSKNYRDGKGQGTKYSNYNGWSGFENVWMEGIRAELIGCDKAWHINYRIFERPSGTGKDGMWSEWYCDGKWIERDGLQITGMQFDVTFDGRCRPPK